MSRVSPLTRAALIVSGVMFVSLGLLVSLIHAAPRDDDPLRDLVTCDGAEPLTCFLGIIPGLTRADEAISILQTHEWVDQFQRYRGMDLDSGFLVWTWSGAQPDLINHGINGRLWYEYGMVRYVYVYPEAQFGDVWLALGQPEIGRVLRASGNIDAFLDAGYFQGGLTAAIDLDCPLRPATFWRSPVMLRANNFRDAAVAVSAGAYQQPDWGQCR